MMLTLILATVLLYLTNALIIPTQETVNAAKSSIEDLIRNNKDGNEFPLIGGFVRLSFHDCVGNGHCDGCINRNLDENKGLPAYIDNLEPIYMDSYEGLMSRADFYALAGLTASEFGANQAGNSFTGFQQFKVGRADCSTTPNEDDFNEIFPSTELTLAESSAFFSNHFGFSTKQTIAILGAHSLGRAKTENSGYEGKWVRGPSSESQLDNKYYDEIVNRPWEQATVTASGEVQWQDNPPNFQANTEADRPDGFMMFNSDIALAFDISPDGEGHVSCSICPANNRNQGLNGQECCEKHTQSAIVEDYASDNQAFLNDYTEAFLAMINHNNNVLAEPETPPTTTTTTTTETAIEATTEATEPPTQSSTQRPIPPGPKHPRSPHGAGPRHPGKPRKGDPKSKIKEGILLELQAIEDELAEIKNDV